MGVAANLLERFGPVCHGYRIALDLMCGNIKSSVGRPLTEASAAHWTAPEDFGEAQSRF